MKAYSTREISELLGMPPEKIRALARTAIVNPQRDARGHLRFSFQDIVLLRTAQGLLADEKNPRRVWRAMRTLGKQQHNGRPLSAIRMRLEGADVLVSSGNTTWNPVSGQTLFDFSRDGAAEKVSLLEPRSTARASQVAKSADDWFELGIALEQVGATLDAEAAYRSAFSEDPSHVDSRINLGRLRHAAQALPEAEALYRRALALDPGHGVAHFNLGVVLEDRGKLEQAMEAYHSALRCDPPVPEAHFNLARLYERCGDQRAALRHLSSFKRLKDR
ncbi:MAG: tetratricopeptide repeat protein [Gammaproteobacteria bacterium]|nr:tetratricopeptide repeat protein [Gammaproteobacteria bacterium]